MPDIDIATSCFFLNNAIHCSIISEVQGLEYAYYININGEGRQVLYYPQPSELAFSCEGQLVDFFEVTFFARDEHGNIHSKSQIKRTPWSLCDAAIFTILQLTNINSTIIELGSGYGSTLISKNRNLISVEHDEKFVSRFQELNYVHAPLITLQNSVGAAKKWYDPKAIKDGIPSNHDMIILDGPPAEVGREGILSNLSLFDSNAIWIVDDVVRNSEQNIANAIALHFSLLQYKFWNFSILTKKPLESEKLLAIKKKSHEEYLSKPRQYLENYFTSPPHFDNQ